MKNYLTRSEPLIDCSLAAAKNSSVAGCAGSIHEEGRFAYAMTLVRVPPKIQCHELPISVPILMACCLLQSLSAEMNNEFKVYRMSADLNRDKFHRRGILKQKH